jgi:nucleoredoxin
VGEGKEFEIIFVSADQDEISAMAYFADMPWMMLTFSDREAQTELSSRYGIRGIPSLVLVDANGTITTNGREAIMSVPFDDVRNFEVAKKAAEAKEKKELEELRMSFKPSTFFSGLVKDKEGGIVPESHFHGKVIGIYFSAHWCPPCRGFTPQLAEKYKSIIAEGKPFEIIFVSSDRDEASANDYYASMPWKMLPFSHRDKKKVLSDLYSVTGIPTLVLVDEDGTITTNGRTVLMAGPFDDIRKSV